MRQKTNYTAEITQPKVCFWLIPPSGDVDAVPAPGAVLPRRPRPPAAPQARGRRAPPLPRPGLPGTGALASLNME